MQDANRKGPYISSPRYAAGPVRPKCPVCGKSVFSNSGIHPQCAVARQDAEFKATQKEMRKAIEASLGEEKSPAAVPGEVPMHKPRTRWSSV
jgi:hypothetical protein